MFTTRIPGQWRHCVRWLVMASVATGVFVGDGAQAAEGFEYLPGGPLAGVKLPPNPRASPARGTPYNELEVSPGSVEHWRDYWMKYCPNRSLFDAASLVKRWPAKQLATDASVSTEQFAEPVFQVGRDSTLGPTGAVREAIAVVRAKVGSTFKLNLGTLDVGMYCVRIVGAVEASSIRPFRKPLYVEWKINDGVQDAKGDSTWRRRLGYVEEMYSVEEFFFHAVEKKQYNAQFTIAVGSEVDLLIGEVTLDDALAGTTRRAIKREQTLTTPEDVETLRANSPDTGKELTNHIASVKALNRLRRDEAIFTHRPPVQLNIFSRSFADAEFEDTAPELRSNAFAKEHGKWELDGWTNFYNWFTTDPKKYKALIVNEKLKLSYSVDDLRMQKPLPEPFPFRDPAGVYMPDPKDPKKGDAVKPLLRVAEQMNGALGGYARKCSEWWLTTGDEELARDGAVALVAFAYNFPAMDNGQNVASFLKTPSFKERDTRFRQRHTYYLTGHYPDYLEPTIAYDRLFPYIKGNEDLAKSINRFIPWVKNSQDVIMLLDTYLVQTTAKRILRYQYHSGGSARICTPAAVLGDSEVCDPWMKWLFAKAFAYPLALSGIDDVMVAAHDRLGAQYIGSHYYARGEGAFLITSQLELYRKVSGTTAFDLSNPAQYQQPLASTYWDIDTVIGGRDIMRIGDVTGPEKYPGQVINTSLLGEKPRLGWEWSKDPKFAWVIKYLQGRKRQSDGQWQEIEKAASTVARAPWLDNRSRAIANWAGVLESGLKHDDFRFRRAVYVRAGLGSGHSHADTLDLQFFAHGLSFTPDDGQRSGYTKPNSRFSRIHNVVEVDGGKNSSEYGLESYGWVRALTDAPDAPYMRTEAYHPQSPTFYRQTALLTLDEGVGSVPLPPEKQNYAAELPKGVKTANGYVFDVFRVGGGSMHTYSFHGPVYDEFNWNIQYPKPVEHLAQPTANTDTEAAYLSIFSDSKTTKEAGDAPATFQATWRYFRGEKMGSEQTQLGKQYDERQPPACTRLTLLGTQGMRALRADIRCNQLRYDMANVMIQKKGKSLSSAFPAIIEAYRGTPSIKSSTLLTLPDNEDDALRAVAVRVETIDGRNDLCFADGRPEKTRTVESGKIAGEFAYVSSDAKGLRQASISGGSLLEAQGITIKPARSSYTAKVTRVDYPGRSIWIDTPWPAVIVGQPFEIGNKLRKSPYTAKAVTPEGSGTRLDLIDGALTYRSTITNVVPEKQRVDGLLESVAFNSSRGGFTLTNDDATKAWKVTGIDSNDFTVDGPVDARDFEPSKSFRLWEYGVGDELALTTFVDVRRLDDGTYEARGNVDVEITVAGKVTRVTAVQFAKGAVRLEGK
jgi:hypothetical protein